MKILHNRVKCLNCGDVIESKHRHDFVWCECKSIFTDGGRSYIRRGGDRSLMEDMTETCEEEEVEPPCDECGNLTDNHKLSCGNRKPFQPSGVLR